ncbi:MAG: hypothetical protein KGH72_05990 [Candidatus Micrarchaeota archaeon]|nr:hypothetical protein [Candidatus Micrarchaeota archaeon]
MSEVPKAVKDKFQGLKEENANIYLKTINGNYYVYRQSYKWQQAAKKSKTTSEYLGKITPQGKFIAKLSSYRDELEKAKEIIEANGGRIYWNEQEAGQPKLKSTVSEINDRGIKILTALSMNARMPISHMSKLTGLKKSTLYYHLKNLEKSLDIRYTLELNAEALGYITYLLLIKFDDQTPNLEDLKKVLEKDPRIQFAAALKGDYDLVIYLLDEGPIKAEDNLWKFRSETLLGSYKALWYLIPLGQIYSFVPIRESFIENVLIEKTATRGKTVSGTAITHKELTLLRELNKNSMEDFTTLDEKYGFGGGTARYVYEKLRDKGIIVRSTINIGKVPMKYLGVMLLETSRAADVNNTRHKLLRGIIQSTSHPTDKYALVGNIGAPGGMMFFMPVFEEEEFEEAFRYYQNEVDGTIMRSMIVTEVLVGSLCYRKFDNHYSRQHSLLVGMRKLEHTHLISYDRKRTRAEADEDLYF